MTDKEKAFMEQVGEFARKHHKEMEELAKTYALENNPYNIGDIVSDNTDKARIEKIVVGKKWNGIPTCIYFGEALKKDGTPRKVAPFHASVRQENI